MVNEEFADAMCRALRAGGLIHIATDDAGYFSAISRQMSGDKRFESAPVFEPSEAERTDYELQWMREKRSISRCSFRKREA